MWEQLLPRAVNGALAAAADPGTRVWLVGGALRDHFLDRPTHDFDFAVSGQARRLAREVADLLGAAYFELDAERDTGRVLPRDEGAAWRSLDFARLRGPDIERDLLLRDFTINSLAVEMADPGQLLDPSGGLQDIKAGTLRLCHPQGLVRDPVRAVRALRLAADLGFRLEPGLIDSIQEAGGKLASASIERVRDELFRMLAQSRPAQGLRIADQLQLAGYLMPGLSGDQLRRGFQRQDHLSRLTAAFVGQHVEASTNDWVTGQASVRLGRFRHALEADLSVSVSGERSRRQLLFWSALYVPEGYPGAKLEPILAHWRLSGRETSKVLRLASAWSSFEGDPLAAADDRRSRYHYFDQLGELAVEMCLLALADMLCRQSGPPAQADWELHVERARRLLAAWYEEPRENIDPEPLVSGDELMRFLEVPAGPLLGELLEAIREEQAAGTIHSQPEALQLAQRLYAQSGSLN